MYLNDFIYTEFITASKIYHKSRSVYIVESECTYLQTKNTSTNVRIDSNIKLKTTRLVCEAKSQGC